MDPLGLGPLPGSTDVATITLLSPLQAGNRRALSGGRWLSVIDFAARHDGPGDARRLVGERHRRHGCGPSRPDGCEPVIGALLVVTHHGMRTEDQQPAHI